MNQLVTIAIPAYKATFLKEALDSAVNQTYKNIEIVVVNDKSPGNIKGIVESYSDDRIRYFENEENIGGKDLTAQWNRCLSYACGDFFCLLCDDDIYAPTFVEELLSLSEKYPSADVFRARAKVIDENGVICDIYPSSPEYETVYDYMWQKWCGARRQTVSEFMIRVSRARTVGGYISLPRAWGSDSLSVFSFGMENGIVSTISILVAFRSSGENISFSHKNDAMEKIRAAKLYREKCYVLISKCNNVNLKVVLEKYEPQDYNLRVFYILTNCTLSSFIKAAFSCHIGLKLLIKAWLGRLPRLLHAV